MVLGASQDSTAAEGADPAADLATISLCSGSPAGSPASSPSAASANSGDDWTMVEVPLVCSCKRVQRVSGARTWFASGAHFNPNRSAESSIDCCHARRREMNTVLQLDAGWVGRCAAACQLTAGQDLRVSSDARTYALYSMYVSG
jgi:hypothetical protein